MQMSSPPPSLLSSKAVALPQRSMVQRLIDAFIESRRHKAAQYIEKYSLTSWTPGAATASRSTVVSCANNAPSEVELIYADSSGA